MLPQNRLLRGAQRRRYRNWNIQNGRSLSERRRDGRQFFFFDYVVARSWRGGPGINPGVRRIHVAIATDDGWSNPGAPTGLRMVPRNDYEILIAWLVIKRRQARKCEGFAVKTLHDWVTKHQRSSGVLGVVLQSQQPQVS